VKLTKSPKMAPDSGNARVDWRRENLGVENPESCFHGCRELEAVIGLVGRATRQGGR
jgi:hypothetical protein